MTHYYRTVKCPYCNSWTDNTHSTSSLYTGSPVRECAVCKKTFIDRERKEEAIMYYLGKTRFSGLILRAVIAVLCLLGGRTMLGTDSTVAIVMFSVSLLLFANLIFCIVNRRLSKLRENLEQQKKLPEDVQKSLNRMSNPEYLEILINHNIDVPEWFFERIGATVVKPEETPVKEQKKYICDNCGATMTGWYQVCPNCGFSGKVRMGNNSEIALWNNKELARVIISKEYPG